MSSTKKNKKSGREWVTTESGARMLVKRGKSKGGTLFGKTDKEWTDMVDKYCSPEEKKKRKKKRMTRKADRLAKRSKRNVKRSKKRRERAEEQMLREAELRDEVAKMKHGGKIKEKKRPLRGDYTYDIELYERPRDARLRRHDLLKRREARVIDPREGQKEKLKEMRSKKGKRGIPMERKAKRGAGSPIKTYSNGGYVEGK